MSFEEQIMSKECIRAKMKVIVFIIHIFFVTLAVFGPIIDAKICSDICPRTLSFREANNFRERSSKKTLSFEIFIPSGICNILFAIQHYTCMFLNFFI